VAIVDIAYPAIIRSIGILVVPLWIKIHTVRTPTEEHILAVQVVPVIVGGQRAVLLPVNYDMVQVFGSYPRALIQRSRVPVVLVDDSNLLPPQSIPLLLFSRLLCKRDILDLL
jgi:hypothetical protein